MLTIEDHFCGAGGNTTGALLVEDVEVVHAANHSILAINTHSSNYPMVEHTCGDIPSMEPKRYPTGSLSVVAPPPYGHTTREMEHFAGAVPESEPAAAGRRP